jgi:hypothetical protein
MLEVFPDDVDLTVLDPSSRFGNLQYSGFDGVSSHLRSLVPLSFLVDVSEDIEDNSNGKTPTLQIQYTVTVESVYTYDQMSTQLSISVSSGAFTDLMQAYAATNSATGLETATSDSVDISDNDDDNNGDNDNKDETLLKDGEIAGVVIGVIAFFSIVGVLVYYFCWGRKSALANGANLEL